MLSDQCTLLMDFGGDEESVEFDNVVTNDCEMSVSDMPLQSESSTCYVSLDIDSIQSTLIQTKRQRDLSGLPEGLKEGKEAHFFVSYCNEDKLKVLPIVAKLEQEHGYACVIHDRDFNPGMEIHENINRFMEKSMKILLFLSEKFLESGYCKHEKNLAFVMSMEAGENKIIPVLLEECTIPSTLKTLTYIDGNAHDVIDKIMTAYDTTDSDILPVEFDQASARKLENGYTITLPSEANKLFNVCRRQGQKVIFGMDEIQGIQRGNFKVSDEITKEAVDIINSHVTSRNWIRSDYPTSCCLGCLSIAFIWAGMYLILMIIILCITDRRFSTQTIEFVKTLPNIGWCTFFGSLILWCTISVMLPRRRFKKTALVMEDIFNKITLKTYKDGVLFKVISFGCRNHVTRYLARKLKQIDENSPNMEGVDSEDDYDARADDYIKRHLYNLIYAQYPEAPENRHNVKGGLSCFCQVLETKLNKP